MNYQDECIKILDWFAENLPDDYHSDGSISEMVITTIERLAKEKQKIENQFNDYRLDYD